MNRYIILLLLIFSFINGCKNQKKNEDSSKPSSYSPFLISSSNNYYNLSADQIKVVNELLSDSAQWRLAIDSDNTNDMLFDLKKEDSTYKPYYLQTDINLDGKTDFVIVLVKGKLMAPFWFCKNDSGYLKANSLGQTNWLDECGLFSKTSGELFIGRFYSDDGIPYQWDTLKKEMNIVNFDDDSIE